jgi:WASH complex subunit 7
MSSVADLVKKRLEDVVENNEIVLSLISSSSSLPSSCTASSSIHSHSHTITASIAHQRSFTNSFVNSIESAIDIDLNPPERTKPQDLLQGCHQQSHDTTTVTSSNNDQATIAVSSHNTHTSPIFQDHLDYHKATIKAITVMTAICDEVHELSTIANEKFLPQLHLFGHEFKLDSSKEINVLDEELMMDRDDEMLKRIGGFIQVLQHVYNFTKRIQSLVKNIVGQVYGCLNPLYDWSTDGESLGSRNIVTLYDAGHGPRLFTHVENVLPLMEALAVLLQILIEIDTVIANNKELAEAWDMYKAVVLDACGDAGDTSKNANGEQHPVSWIEIHDDKPSNSEKPEQCGDGGNITTTNSDKETEEDFYEANETMHGSKLNETNTSEVSMADNENDEGNDNDENAKSYNFAIQDLHALQRMLMQLDFTLLSSRSFLIAIEQNFDTLRQLEHIEQDAVKDALPQYIKEGTELLFQKCCIDLDEENTIDDEQPIIGIYGLYCLYRRLLASDCAPDLRLHKRLIKTFSLHIIPIHGDLPFYPSEFVSRYAPMEIPRSSIPTHIDDIKVSVKKHLSSQDKLFVGQVSKLYREGMAWMISAELELGLPKSIVRKDDNSHQRSVAVESICRQVDIILHGIDIARRAKVKLQLYLVTHQNLLEPVPTSHVPSLEKLCYLAKGIEAELMQRKRKAVITIHKAAMKFLSSSLFHKLDSLRSYVDQKDSGLDESDEYELRYIQMSRISAGLGILESILKGSSNISSTRFYAIKAALGVCDENLNGEHTDEKVQNFDEIANKLRKLQTFSNLDGVIRSSCDCYFLYYHKALHIPLVHHTRIKGSRMQMIFTALSDASKRMLTSSKYLVQLYDKQLYLEDYKRYLIEKVIHPEVLIPIVQDIENVLRQRILSRDIPEMPLISPRDTHIDFARLNMPPLIFCGVRYHLKHAIEGYLESSFYNSSTVGLQDTRNHTEMLKVAQASYGIKVIDGHLPLRSADQGMDLVTIVSNLEEFLSAYNYNMNQQIFVEKSPTEGSRSIHTVDIKCMSSSLTYHGVAIASSLVPTISKYISKSISDLMEIFQNEIFYSCVAKEKRWFDEAIVEGYSHYPYDRAMQLRKELDEQFSDEMDGVSLLEKGKKIATMMGNALGLMRTIKSAVFHHDQKRDVFCKIIKGKLDSIEFEADECIAKVMNEVKDIVQSKSAEFPLFPVFPCENGHEKVFNCLFIAFPCLSLSWLESSAVNKEALRRKIKTSQEYFSDDGFALGFAYLFEVVGKTQGKVYDTMNWSQSVRQWFKDDKAEILQKVEEIRKDRRKNSQLLSQSDPDTDDELTRLQVIAKRLETRKQEMDLLLNCMNAARMMYSYS